MASIKQFEERKDKYHIVKYMRAKGVDGLLWCAMRSGANNASYLKPPIDFYGYAKHAFFSLKEGFAPTICFNEKVDVVVGEDYEICPVLTGADENSVYNVTINLLDNNSKKIDSKVYNSIFAKSYTFTLSGWKPNFSLDGYYAIEYIVEKTKCNI